MKRASGSAVTVDVVISLDVRVAAAANRTLTSQGVDGNEIAAPLRSRELAAASEGSPESLAYVIGKEPSPRQRRQERPRSGWRGRYPAADPVSTYISGTRQL